MLSEILSKETCKKCKFCCVFSPSAIWEIPDEIDVDRSTLTDEVFCPYLNDKTGCTKGEDKPIECKMWPLRVMRKGKSIFLTVSTRCYAYSQEFSTNLYRLLSKGLFERVKELIKTNPEIIKEYHPSYRILCSLDGEKLEQEDSLFFRCAEIGDANRINISVMSENEPICEYSVGSIIALAQKSDTELCFENGRMNCLMPGRTVPGYASYLMPITDDIVQSVDAIKKHSDTLGLKTLIWGARKSELDILANNGIEYEAEEMRDWFDYIYKTNDLAELSGSKLRKRRVAYNKFTRDFEGRYSFCKITPDDIDKIRAYQKKWLENRTAELGLNKGLISENDQIEYILSNYKLLETRGAYTEIDGKVVGYTLCVPLGRDCLDMTTLKCDREYPNLNIFTISSFCKLNTSFEYVNFEEDIGSEGLRKFKSDLQPYKLLEKYRVYLK